MICVHICFFFCCCEMILSSTFVFSLQIVPYPKASSLSFFASLCTLFLCSRPWSTHNLPSVSLSLITRFWAAFVHFHSRIGHTNDTFHPFSIDCTCCRMENDIKPLRDRSTSHIHLMLSARKEQKYGRSQNSY